MGFLTTLPSIWRALQCLRRYRDTRNLFPHIVNFGKYACSILYYMSLSMYRIDEVGHLRALFITFALINAIYTSIWDVAMDWSLGNPYSKNPFLRDSLAFRKRWIYYVAMAVDPILRFNWIFYAIFTHETQHSAVLSFLISFSEVCRRGLWSILRVENEHCTNVCRFRASRDVPLPFDIPTTTSVQHAQSLNEQEANGVPIGRLPTATSTTGADIEHLAATDTNGGSSIGMRHRHGYLPDTPSTVPSGTLARVGTLLANAHAQDFERRKRPGVVGATHDRDEEEVRRHGHGHSHSHGVIRRDSSTDDEEEEEEEEDDDDEVLDQSETEHERSGSEDYSGELSLGRRSMSEDEAEHLRN